MPYIRAEVVVDFAPLNAIEQRGRAMPRLLETATKREIGRITSDFIKEIATPLGPHVSRKDQWQTAKQRRWWWAVGVHQWHGRTDKLQKGWEPSSKTSQAGGIFSVYNTQPYKVFVQGIWQQRMHMGVWQNEAAVIVKYQVIAQLKLTEIFKTVSNPFAGVPQT